MAKILIGMNLVLLKNKIKILTKIKTKNKINLEILRTLVISIIKIIIRNKIIPSNNKITTTIGLNLIIFRLFKPHKLKATVINLQTQNNLIGVNNIANFQIKINSKNKIIILTVIVII